MKTFERIICSSFVAIVLGQFAGVVRAGESRQPPAGAESRSKSPPSFCNCVGAHGPSVERIKKALASPLKSTGLEFTEEPLANVVEFLMTEFDIPIQIDERALEKAGITRDTPITINIRDISLRSAIGLTLKTQNLAYMVRNEVLTITTPEEAEAELTTCVYDVRDLIGENRDNRDIKALADAIVSCVAWESWAKHGGGEAEIKILRPGLLAISQSQAVHDEISDFLSVIREMAKTTPGETTVRSGVADLGQSAGGEPSGGPGRAPSAEAVNKKGPEPTPIEAKAAPKESDDPFGPPK